MHSLCEVYEQYKHQYKDDDTMHQLCEMCGKEMTYAYSNTRRLIEWSSRARRRMVASVSARARGTLQVTKDRKARCVLETKNLIGYE